MQCVYTANQEWRRLFWIYDIIALIHANEINWNIVMDNAKKLGFQRIVLINIFLAKTLFELEIPEEIEYYLNSDDKIKNISIKILKKLFNDYQIKESDTLNCIRENKTDNTTKDIIHSLIRPNNDYSVSMLEYAISNFSMRENITDGTKDNIRSIIMPTTLNT